MPYTLEIEIDGWRLIGGFPVKSRHRLEIEVPKHIVRRTKNGLMALMDDIQRDIASFSSLRNAVWFNVDRRTYVLIIRSMTTAERLKYLRPADGLEVLEETIVPLIWSYLDSPTYRKRSPRR